MTNTKKALALINCFTNGDKVILQNVYNFVGVGDQVAFDVFRFEDGLIAEHWDVMETLISEDEWKNTNGKF